MLFFLVYNKTLKDNTNLLKSFSASLPKNDRLFWADRGPWCTDNSRWRRAAFGLIQQGLKPWQGRRSMYRKLLCCWQQQQWTYRETDGGWASFFLNDFQICITNLFLFHYFFLTTYLHRVPASCRLSVSLAINWCWLMQPASDNSPDVNEEVKRGCLGFPVF